MNSILKLKNLNTVNLEKIDFFNNHDVRYKPSSVFILIFSSKNKNEILFLKRSNNLELHKGEICFPGGSYEEDDQDLLSTAYRELEEEVGIKKSDINALTFLEDEITRTGFIIKPFVGVVIKQVKIKIDNKEITDYFKLPIENFEDNKNKRYFYSVINNNLEKKVSYSIQGRVIWGATANILNQLLKKI